MGLKSINVIGASINIGESYMLLVRKIAVFLGVFALLFIVSSGPATAAADPSVTVSDQVTMDSTVVIDKIVAVEEGWVGMFPGCTTGDEIRAWTTQCGRTVRASCGA